MMTFVHSDHRRNSALLSTFIAEAGAALFAEAPLPLGDAEWQFTEGVADSGLLSPLAYGKREGEVVLLPGASLTAYAGTGDIRLLFRGGLKSFATLGHYHDPDLELMLAQVLLKEKYGMEPRLLRVKGDVAEVMPAVDALLLGTRDTDRAALGYSALDMIDEWFDMTQLPFVRELFMAWEHRVDPAVVAAVMRAGEVLDEQALREVEQLLLRHDDGPLLSAVPAHYRYRLDDDAMEGLRQFFQFAFYHGLHRDIPDFRVWESEAEG
jgi:predicted solute-binding protein